MPSWSSRRRCTSRRTARSRSPWSLRAGTRSRCATTSRRRRRRRGPVLSSTIPPGTAGARRWRLPRAAPPADATLLGTPLPPTPSSAFAGSSPSMTRPWRRT
ncbi:MAG: hypothetical protein AMS14_09635 [Planctomycetes bacterium DG_20]|nr:MAG: hypothetical protein AMS14_09635 [Planctomycetes bacterium DG_20]